MTRLAGKIAIITGAGRGIGRAIAVTFAREGCAVAVADVNEEFARETVTAIEETGGICIAVTGDVSKQGDILKMRETVEGKLGGIDILVNNAGVFTSTAADACTEAEWDWIMNINLRGQFFLSQAVLEPMKRRGGGAIVNMSSMAGKIGGIVGSVPYSVSKAGVVCLTKALARHWGKYAIRVNAIAPGVIETEMTKSHPESFWINAPIARKGTPEEVADCALFLASDESRYITGKTIDVNGGMYMD